MAKHDWSQIAESTGFGPGKHVVKFGAWSFEESKNGKYFLQLNWEKDGHYSKDGKPFTSSRLYFSSERAVGMSKHLLHLLCEKSRRGVPPRASCKRGRDPGFGTRVKRPGD